MYLRKDVRHTLEYKCVRLQNNHFHSHPKWLCNFLYRLRERQKISCELFEHTIANHPFPFDVTDDEYGCSFDSIRPYSNMRILWRQLNVSISVLYCTDRRNEGVWIGFAVKSSRIRQFGLLFISHRFMCQCNLIKCDFLLLVAMSHFCIHTHTQIHKYLSTLNLHAFHSVSHSRSQHMHPFRYECSIWIGIQSVFLSVTLNFQIAFALVEFQLKM